MGVSTDAAASRTDGGREQWHQAVFYVIESFGLKKWPDHKRPFRDWFLRYCVTPPVTPPLKTRIDQHTDPKWTSIESLRTPHPKECIVCGRHHITSEDCGRERPDTTPPDAGTRMAVGYRLSRAEGMGFFGEGVLE